MPASIVQARLARADAFEEVSEWSAVLRVGVVALHEGFAVQVTVPRGTVVERLPARIKEVPVVYTSLDAPEDPAPAYDPWRPSGAVVG